MKLIKKYKLIVIKKTKRVSGNIYEDLQTKWGQIEETRQPIKNQFLLNFEIILPIIIEVAPCKKLWKKRIGIKLKLPKTRKFK